MDELSSTNEKRDNCLQVMLQLARHSIFNYNWCPDACAITRPPGQRHSACNGERGIKCQFGTTHSDMDTSDKEARRRNSKYICNHLMRHMIGQFLLAINNVTGIGVVN